MKLGDFLSHIAQGEAPDSLRIVFQGKECPTFFLSRLFLEIKKMHPLATVIDAEVQSLAATKAQLAMSFLGNRILSLIKNVHRLDAAAKKSWNVFIKEYQGPHCILFFSNITGSYEGAMSVELPEDVDRKLYRTLCAFFYKAEPDPSFLEKIFS